MESSTVTVKRELVDGGAGCGVGGEDCDSGHSSPTSGDENNSLLVNSLGSISLTSSTYTNGSCSVASSDTSNDDAGCGVGTSVIESDVVASSTVTGATTGASTTSSLITAPTSWQPFVSVCSSQSSTSRSSESEYSGSGHSGSGSYSGMNSILNGSTSYFDVFDQQQQQSSSVGAYDLFSSESSSYSSPFFTPRQSNSPPLAPLWSSASSNYMTTNEPDIWGRPPSMRPNVGYIGRPQYPLLQSEGHSQQQQRFSSNLRSQISNSFVPTATNRVPPNSSSSSYGLMPHSSLPCSSLRTPVVKEELVQNILRFYAIFLDNLHPKTDVSKLVSVFSKYGTIRAVDIKPVLGITSTYACIEFNDHESPERAVTDALNDAIIPKLDLVFDLKSPLIVKFTPSSDQRRNLSSGSLAWNWAKTMIERSGECFEWRFNSSCSAGRHCYRKHVVKHRCIDTLKSFSL